jgi:hypothetical protein
MSETELVTSTRTRQIASANTNRLEQPNHNVTKYSTKEANRQKNKFTKWNQPLHTKNEPTWNEFNPNLNYQFQPVKNAIIPQLKPTAMPFNYNSGLTPIFNPNYHVTPSFSMTSQMYPTLNFIDSQQPTYQTKFPANISNIRPFEPKQRPHLNTIDTTQNNEDILVNADKKDKQVAEKSESKDERDENEPREDSSTKNEPISEINTKRDTINQKTPMCLVNELVKYNKIKHEYVLLDEIGPAHKKKFYVALKLGVGTEHEETFSSNGSSIKKAQHAAAEMALKTTKFKRPEPKANRINVKFQNRTKSDTKEANENTVGLQNPNNRAKKKTLKKQSNFIS